MNWDIVKGVLILLLAVSALGPAFVLISARDRTRQPASRAP